MQLIPKDAGPNDPRKFTLFCPFLGGITVEGIGPSLLDPSSSSPRVDRQLLSATLASSSASDLEILLGSLGHSLPVYLAYVDVALARTSVPIPLPFGNKDGVQVGFRAGWETLLFGFELTPDGQEGGGGGKPTLGGSVEVRSGVYEQKQEIARLNEEKEPGG